jgi:hypothetical protein
MRYEMDTCEQEVDDGEIEQQARADRKQAVVGITVSFYEDG